MKPFASALERATAEAATLAQAAPIHPSRLRLGLVLIPGLTSALVLALTLALTPPPTQAPDLIRLLRGMVLIKGSIGLAAATLVWWRLGRPISAPLAARYVAAVAVSAGAVAWLWGLHLLALGSGVFYLGLLGLYLAARQDPLLGYRAVPPSR